MFSVESITPLYYTLHSRERMQLPRVCSTAALDFWSSTPRLWGAAVVAIGRSPEDTKQDKISTPVCSPLAHSYITVRATTAREIEWYHYGA